MTAATDRKELRDPGMQADELPPGARLLDGQFTIESFLNSGGFGIVYLARDSLDRRVVIKECFPTTFCRRLGKTVGVRSRQQMDEFRSAVRSFIQEAQTLAQLNHPNIVKVHHVFEDNETAYIAMDHIDGPDLLQTVEGTAAPLTVKETIAHLNALLDAVDHVHQRGLLHRDISPDNILLDKATGQPILIDFGASRKEVTRKSRALSGLRVVKDGYSPQEFYVTGSKQAPFSDLYALAATFYHLISGETPKTSQERLSAIAGREGDPLRPLTGRFKAYPKEFLQAIDKAMSIFPRDRLQSVSEWRDILGGLVQVKPEAPRAAAGTPAAVPLAATTKSAAAPASTLPPVPLAPRPAARVDVASVVSIRGPRDLLVSSAAAVLLLVGLLSLPTHLRSSGDAAAIAATAPAATATVAADPAAGGLLAVTSTLRLPGGLTFDMVQTATGYETVVTALPGGASGTIAVGDVLLVYTPTGETLGTASALRDILTREFGNGVTTYSFVIRRGASSMNADFSLPAAG